MQSPKYQRFVQDQLSDVPLIQDQRVNIESPQQKNLKQKRQINYPQNFVPLSNYENFKYFQSSTKIYTPTETINDSEIKKTFLSRRGTSYQMLRMKKQCNKMHKSRSQIDGNHISNRVWRTRRRSGCEQISQKQIRLDSLYPTTFVYFHMQEKNVRKNEMRKKSIFKRMSSILIKHSNTIRSSMVGSTNENNLKQEDRSPAGIIRQFQMQVGELKESEEFINNLQNSEKFIQLQEELKRFSKSVNNSPTLKRNSKKTQSDNYSPQQRVVLDVSKQQRKTFTSVQNYITERSLGKAPSSGGFSYLKLQSLTETDSSSPLKLKSTMVPFKITHIKSLSNLPEIRETVTQRSILTKTQKTVEKVKNIYISSPQKKKPWLEKFKM